MTISRETVRLLRLAGAGACVLVALPPIVEGVEDPTYFLAWLASLALFAVVFEWTTSRLSSPRQLHRFAIALESACPIAMATVQYRGLEGTLLVLVALQLGLIGRRRLGLTWIAVQSLGLMWAIRHHWSLRPALMWAPPYLGFQVLTYLVVELLGREAQARAALASTNAELLATRERLAESARLGERLRIAGELHDAIGHHLVGLSLNLEALAQKAAPSPQLETAQSLTRRLLDDVEMLVDTLGREQRVDLSRALAAMTVDIPRPRVHVNAEALELNDPERVHALWRCCQEIVTNAVKHANAENLWMNVCLHDGRVELTARDDGSGATRVTVGHGLASMRRRLEQMGGALALETQPGAGFHVKVTLPWTPP